MKHTMRKLLAVLVIVAIPVIYFLYVFQPNMPLFPQMLKEDGPLARIGNVPIRVAVADTDALRTKGLGGRDALDVTSGMLFVFDKSDYHQIWMKDMRLVIDVIWIDERFRVIDIQTAVRPDTYPQTFEPVSPARFVIETNAHYAESFGIAVGDVVTLPDELVPKDLR